MHTYEPRSIRKISVAGKQPLATYNDEILSEFKDNV